VTFPHARGHCLRRATPTISHRAVGKQRLARTGTAHLNVNVDSQGYSHNYHLRSIDWNDSMETESGTRQKRSKLRFGPLRGIGLRQHGEVKKGANTGRERSWHQKAIAVTGSRPRSRSPVPTIPEDLDAAIVVPVVQDGADGYRPPGTWSQRVAGEEVASIGDSLLCKCAERALFRCWQVKNRCSERPVPFRNCGQH
jgi:hypothetical protein